MTSFGNLYQGGKVSPTFQKVLEVDYVPASYDAVYIRQFIGSYYTGTSWSDTINTNLEVLNKYETMANDTLRKIYEDPDHPLHNYVYKATMNVRPLHESGALIPYFSIEDYLNPTFRYDIRERSATSTRSAFDYLTSYKPEFATYPVDTSRQYTYEYYQLIPVSDSYSDVERYREFDYTPDEDAKINLQSTSLDLSKYILVSDEAYLTRMKTVSDPNPSSPKVARALMAICLEQNFHGTVLDRVEQLQEFFSDYTYTLNPGNLPKNEDFILYFLTKSKHGFCQHFASSAVMLLRTMNIPARYVEGYMFSFADVSGNSEILEDIDPNTMHEGASIFSDAPVVNVPVNDASGHAWVEIFFPELGWVPFEFTVGMNGDQDDESDFEFWNGSTILDDIDFSPVAGLFQVDLTFAAKLLLRLLIIVAVGVTILLIVRFIILLVKEKETPELYHSGLNLKILETYRSICKKYSLFGLLPKEDMLYRDFTSELQSRYDFSEDKAASLRSYLEDAAYGPEDVSEVHYRETNVLLTEVRQKLDGSLTAGQKLKYRLRTIFKRKKTQ